MNDDGTVHDDKLAELARRLGAVAAERIDVERTAAAVVARLREERQAPRPLWARVPASWLRIAAALVLLGGASIVARGIWPRASGVAPQAETIDLGELSPAQLRDVLNSLDQPGAPEPAPAQDVGLEDLTPQQLRTLLASLEG
jgi:hypothetical protein